MPEPELHVRDLTPPVPGVVCDSGRHFVHPGETCEEIDELKALFQAYLERSFAAVYARAMAEADAVVDRFLIEGDGTGECLGFLARDDVPEPTEAERAFAILEPHLHDVPLYRPTWQHGPQGGTIHRTLL